MLNPSRCGEKVCVSGFDREDLPCVGILTEHLPGVREKFDRCLSTTGHAHSCRNAGQRGSHCRWMPQFLSQCTKLFQAFARLIFTHTNAPGAAAKDAAACPQPSLLGLLTIQRPTEVADLTPVVHGFDRMAGPEPLCGAAMPSHCLIEIARFFPMVRQ